MMLQESGDVFSTQSEQLLKLCDDLSAKALAVSGPGVTPADVEVALRTVAQVCGA